MEGGEGPCGPSPPEIRSAYFGGGGTRQKTGPDTLPPSIVVVSGKGGKDRLVPMNARLQQTVNDLLFMERLEPLVLAEAGVRYRNPHTARHTFATRWLRRGERLETLSLVMGHANIETTHTLYAHLYTSDILIDVARIDALSWLLSSEAELILALWLPPDRQLLRSLRPLEFVGSSCSSPGTARSC